MDRRDFLADLARLAALTAVIPNDWRVTLRPRFADDPFTLGVASGDPTPGGAVLWTRLAPRPLDPDGGMLTAKAAVDWEVAEDDRFAKVVQKGRATAAIELGYSVHVDVTGLQPDRWYWYRFRSGEATSPVGMLRTTPAAGAVVPLAFAFMSCQKYDDGFFTAYAQYKGDPLLQAAHARCPWLVTWDDHEVDNNYAASVGENEMESEEQVRARRAAGYQAWWEHQPVRVPRVRSWADLTITRSADWGALARLWVLDTRQYRDDQACGDRIQPYGCGAHLDPSRTLLGAAQERWLVDGIGASTARWQVLANQVMLAPADSAPGPEVTTSMDQWSGYPVARDRLLAAIAERAPNRTVAITGDIHTNWVNELRRGFLRPDQPVVAAEFVGTSITSDGDGRDIPAERWATMQRENPHVHWYQSRRGYVHCRVDQGAWHTDYRTVPYVRQPDAPVETATRWRLEHGRPGIVRV
jgi:alkaline phosphatase D